MSVVARFISKVLIFAVIGKKCAGKTQFPLFERKRWFACWFELMCACFQLDNVIGRSWRQFTAAKIFFAKAYGGIGA
jgi:hypothetical protein